MRALALLCVFSVLGCTVFNSRDGLVDESGDRDQDESTSDPAASDGDGDTGDGDGDSGDGDENPGQGDAGDGDTGDGDTGDGDTSDGEPGDGDRPPADAGVNPPEELDAGAGPFVVFDELLLPTGIALRAGEVCFVGGVEPRALYCGPRDGSDAPRPITSDSDLGWLDDAFDLTFDDANVYWSNGKNNQIVRRALSGGGASEYFTGGGRIAYLSAGPKIYATNYGQNAAGHVIRGPHGNGKESELIYPGEASAAGVAIVNDTVFWGTSEPDQLAFGDSDGNAHVTRVDADGPVTGVAVDGDKHAYFIAGDQRIYYLQPGSVTPKLMHEAAAPFGTSDIAVDDRWVYWSEREAGRILRMRR